MNNMDRLRGMIRGGPHRMVPPRTPFEETPSSDTAPITRGPRDPFKAGSSSNQAAQTDSDANEASPRPGPSVLDVLVTKALLHKGCNLPIELVDVIIEHAEYWPHTTVSADFSDSDGTDSLPVYGSGANNNEFLLRTLPLGFHTQRHSDLAQHYGTKPAPKPLSTEHPLEHLQSCVGSIDPTVTNPCRKIVFTITSRDQGWGGEYDCHGTFKHSYTWFDVGLERFDAGSDSEKGKSDSKLHFSELRSVIPQTEEGPPPRAGDNWDVEHEGIDAENGDSRPEEKPQRHFVHDMMPDEKKIQCNKLAESEDRTYRIEWNATDNVRPESAEGDQLEQQGRGRNTGTGEFVRYLKLGDVVTIWAKARFPGWVNHVRSVKVEVYWAV